MLFNNIDEIKQLTGFVYAYNNFDNMRTDIELAEEDIKAIVGAGIYDVAAVHYAGNNVSELLDSLVTHFQIPIAYHAIHSFSQNSDISHEDSGRKVKIDAEREKLPWEWMLEKDERALLRKAHRTTDRLIRFLDENIDEPEFDAWKTSTERMTIVGNFIPDADTFDSIYPIESSRRFFLKIAPFMREAERKYILPVLSQPIFDAVKNNLLTIPANAAVPENILPLIQVPLAYFTMAIAVNRLNIEILPEGVFHIIIAERSTQNAKVPAIRNAKQDYTRELEKQAFIELHFLQEFLRKQNDGEEYIQRNFSQGLEQNQYFARV